MSNPVIQNKLLRESFEAIPAEQKAEFELSYSIAERLDAAMKSCGISRQALAKMMGKRDSEVARWLTGRYDFTTSTIAQIETALNTKLIQVAKAG